MRTPRSLEGRSGRWIGRRSPAHPLIALFAVGVMLVGWCGQSGASPRRADGQSVPLVSTTPKPKGDLSSITWDVPEGTPGTLDYVKSGDYSPDLLIEQMCTDLVRLTPTFGYKPALAKSWKYTNPTTLVFTIRQGVHFWNGHELTAATVAYSMLRNLTPKNTPDNINYYRYVKSITVTGPFQVTVHFTAPNELFIKEMATISGAIAEKSYIEAKGSSYGTSTGGVMCTGPYELTTWNPGSDLVLKANPDFWTPAYKPKIQKITVKFITTTSTLTSALLSGEITGAYQVPSVSFPELESASSVGKLYFGRSLATIYLGVMTKTGPVGNTKIRQAISLAVNRAAIASKVFYSAATPSKTLTPESTWDPTGVSIYKAAYAKLPSLSPDLAKARALVKSVPNHSATITLALTAATETQIEEATVVQEAADSIGLNVKLDELQPLAYSNAYYEASYRKGIDLFLATGYLDVPDPLDYLSLMISKGALLNWTNYANPTVLSDLADAYHTYTNAKRAHLITAAQAIYTKDLVLAIPLLNPDEALFLNKRLTGSTVSFAYIYEPVFAELGAAK